MIDEIGIVEQLNQRLGINSRKKVSTGVVVKAMLLNGLGFVSAPMYLFEKFFQGKATEQLLGLGIKPEYLNDDRLGDVLDELYDAGLSELFLEISLQAARRFEVKQETAHLDSTSFHVDGKYEVNKKSVEPGMMEIASGNQSDKARFAGLLNDFQQQWTFEGLCIADGALAGCKAAKSRLATL